MGVWRTRAFESLNEKILCSDVNVGEHVLQKSAAILLWSYLQSISNGQG
jgi:hypothetical protein